MSLSVSPGRRDSAAFYAALTFLASPVDSSCCSKGTKAIISWSSFLLHVPVSLLEQCVIVKRFWPVLQLSEKIYSPKQIFTLCLQKKKKSTKKANKTPKLKPQIPKSQLAQALTYKKKVYFAKREPNHASEKLHKSILSHACGALFSVASWFMDQQLLVYLLGKLAVR